MFMYLGASSISPKRMNNIHHSHHSEEHGDFDVLVEEEEFDDGLGTAILRRGSNPRNIVVDRDHRKGKCSILYCACTVPVL